MEQLRLPNFPDNSEFTEQQSYSGILTPEREQEPQVFLKPVETFHCAPDDSGYIGERIDAYFEEVVNILDYNDRAREFYLKIEYKTPYFEGEDDAKLYPTDDRIGYLRAQNKLIAFILEARTEFNYIDVTMVCTLTSGLLSLLQGNEALLKKN